MFFINPFIYAGGGDFESIATVTVGSGGASSIEFTSIPSTYQHLQLRAVLRSTYSGSTAAAVQMKVNGSGIDRNHALQGNGTSAIAYTGTSGYIFNAPGAASTASAFGAWVIDILDYASTTKNKVIRTFGGTDQNGIGFVEVTSGLEQTLSAITSLALAEPDPLYKLAQHSTVALYGVKAP
jgi:hypothetical protein